MAVHQVDTLAPVWVLDCHRLKGTPPRAGCRRYRRNAPPVGSALPGHRPVGDRSTNANHYEIKKGTCPDVRRTVSSRQVEDEVDPHALKVVRQYRYGFRLLNAIMAMA